MASQILKFALADAGSMALSGTKNVDIAVPVMTQKMIIKVAAKYAAVAGTSGIAVAFKYSVDGGSTYSTSAVVGSTVAPAATVLGSQLYEIGISDLATRQDAGSITHYRVGLTNADGTNAVTYVVEYAAE